LLAFLFLCVVILTFYLGTCATIASNEWLLRPSISFFFHASSNFIIWSFQFFFCEALIRQHRLTTSFVSLTTTDVLGLL